MSQPAPDPLVRIREKMERADLTSISLGAGVQSTTIALMCAEGILPMPDLAIMADTGWEPAAVYAHFDRLRPVLEAAGMEVQVVSFGNLRDDMLDENRTVNMPLYLAGEDGGRGGMTMRTCTDRYKLAPIFREYRKRLGATVKVLPCGKCGGSGERVTEPNRRAGLLTPGTCSVCRGAGEVTRVGTVEPGKRVVQMIGFSTDEVERVGTDHPTKYAENIYPLLDLGFSRSRCIAWLERRGWSTAKSACIGCTFHQNKEWRHLRDTSPAEWQDAVEFDAAIRVSARNYLRGTPYLHGSMLPLDQAPIDRITPSEALAGQMDLLDVLAIEGDSDAEATGDSIGCSPYGCRSGQVSVLHMDPTALESDDMEGEA